MTINFDSDEHFDAGWSSLVARRAHNPKVGGSNPPPATNMQKKGLDSGLNLFFMGLIETLAPKIWIPVC